jgi:GTPase
VSLRPTGPSDLGGPGGPPEDRRTGGRALVLHPMVGRAASEARDPDAQLEEAVGLAAAIELDVVHAELVRVVRPQPATLLGSGAVERITHAIETDLAPIELVVVDHALSPVQQRNLERAWKAKVIDRTGLILEIFGARARTREGTLQVELAALSYQRSRLVRSWTHLERQRGGFGFLGGPGESQLEIDRRLIGERIAKLKRELEQVRRTRDLHRAARKRVPYPVVALVGYTNAGKSTLFNRLSGADVRAEDLLFATLDPTMRGITLPSGRRVILSDTVGFISDLPTTLVAAFRATLEEVEQADVILHVRDLAHPDTEAQREDVLEVLSELGIDGETDSRLLEVGNKIDLMSDEARRHARARSTRHAEPIPISALTGEGIDTLLRRIEERIEAERRVMAFEIDLADGGALAFLHREGDVLAREDNGERGRARVTVGLEPGALERFERQYPYRPV